MAAVLAKTDGKRGRKNKQKTTTSKGGYKMTYPVVEEPLRTHQETLKEACQAELDGLSQQGVKGLSWLFRCPHFDIIRGVTIDYMHTICLGVVKTLLEKWILLKHKKETFSLVGVIDQLDARLLAMTPPNKVGRLLRSVRDLGDWKACELRAFLLFYGVPCLQDLLPQQYLQHIFLPCQRHLCPASGKDKYCRYCCCKRSAYRRFAPPMPACMGAVC